MAIKESLEFGISPSIIRHLIESQAGSMEKAILEACMNSIDSGPTRIDIRFNSNKEVVIEDDGRGFSDYEEIMENFKTFGFDHNTESEMKKGRMLGRFGLGRGQLMAFAATEWLTNEFIMKVDIRSEEEVLGFDLEIKSELQHQGCKIIATLYEDLNRVQIENIKREIKKQVLYTPVDVYIDSEKVNRELGEEKWTEENEALLFKVKNNSQSGVEFYNQGIYIRTYPHHAMGVSGVMVSKVGFPFTVNIARNDVLQSKCALWKKARTITQKYSELRSKKRTLNDSDRMAIIQGLIAGEQLEGLEKIRLFKDVRGRYLTFSNLSNHAKGAVTVSDRNRSQVGETIHTSKIAVVLSPEVKDWFGVEDGSELVKRIKDVHSTGGARYKLNITHMEFESVASHFSGKHRNIEMEKWTKMETAQINALTEVSYDVVSAVNGFLNRGWGDLLQERKIVLGESENALMWTDGARFISVEKDFMKRQFNNGMNGILRLVNILVHEYLHEDSDEDDHVHGEAFFENYEGVVTSTLFDGFTIARCVLEAYGKWREKLGLKTNTSISRSLDNLDRVDDLSKQTELLFEKT